MNPMSFKVFSHPRADAHSFKWLGLGVVLQTGEMEVTTASLLVPRSSQLSGAIQFCMASVPRETIRNYDDSSIQFLLGGTKKSSRKRNSLS